MSKKNIKKYEISIVDSFWVSSNHDHNAIPLDCPICKLLLDGKNDVLSYKTNGCCASCADAFVYANKTKWKNGWRPDENQICNQREKRLSVPTYIL